MTRRYYFAVTNACNRSCEFCSCYSRPGKKTYLSLEKFKEILPTEGLFEIQLEGGEPLIHPRIEEMIRYAQATGRCEKVILGTNAVMLPYQYSEGRLDPMNSVESIKRFFLRFNPPFLLKPSINYHLAHRDPLHLDKAEILRDSFSQLHKHGAYELKFNVRLRRKPLSQEDATKIGMAEDGDQWLVDELKRRGLHDLSNIFFLQRYGMASGWEGLERPFIIPNPVEFHLIDPNGRDWGTDLVARSEGMRGME